MASPRSLRALLRLAPAALPLRASVFRPTVYAASHLSDRLGGPCQCGTRQTRSYAVARKAPRSTVANWGVVDLDAITLKDFERALRPDALKKKTADPFFSYEPETYRDCLETFAAVSDKGGHRWLELVDPAKRPKADVLHETGCILRDMGWLPQASRWSLPMWGAASELDFDPSTVTLAMYLVRSGMLGTSPLFRPAETRLQALIRAGRDPNALVVEGELLRRRGSHAASLRVLQRALEVGGSAGFAWAAVCEQQMAQCLRALGRDEEALGHFRRAAAMGLEEAHEGVALLSGDAGEAYESMYRAACLDPRLFSRVAEMELDRASTLGGEEAKREAARWATEWSALADVPPRPAGRG